MLSSVLRSQRAIRANVEIMRAFVRLRRVLAVNAELARRLDELQRRVGGHDEQFAAVIQAIRELMEPPPTAKRTPIGYQTEADA
jgi:GAF domain-containing protein